MNKDLGAWRDAEISPLYNSAGIQRFAYILPAGAPEPPAAPDKKSPGEDFYTRFFATEDAAYGWVAA
jgi:hypothetical protein